MASKFYTPVGKEVYPFNIARAAQLNAVNSSVDVGFTLVETDLTALDTRIDSIEGNEVTAGQSITAVTARTTAIELEVDGIDTELNGIDQSISTLNNKTAAIELEINGIDQSILNINSNIDSVETDVYNLEQTFAAVNTNIDAIELEVDGIDQSLIDLNNSVDAIELVLDVADLVSTSSSSNLIESGINKTFIVSELSNYIVGTAVLVTYVNDISHWMHGYVISFDRVTRELILDVGSSSGTGTYADWIITNSSHIISTLEGLGITKDQITEEGDDQILRVTAEGNTQVTRVINEGSTQVTRVIDSTNTFRNQYLGPKSTEPTLNNTGGALASGAIFFDTTESKMKVFNGTAWQPTESSIQGLLDIKNYTATEGQTTFAATYDVGFVFVYVNGIRLVTTDYTAINETSVILAEPLGLGDLVEIVSYGAFELANVYTMQEADFLLDTKADQITTYTKIEADGLLDLKADKTQFPTPAISDVGNSLTVLPDLSNAYLPVRARKNYIIDGNFDVWLEGTSQTTSGYGSDTMWFKAAGGSTMTNSRQAFALGQADVPGNPKYFSRMVVNSVPGVSNYAQKIHKVEGIGSLSGKNATLSFWAKADSNKSIAFVFYQYFGSGGAPSTPILNIAPNKIAITTAWTQYSVTVSIPSVTGKTLGTNGNDALSLEIWFDAGSDYNTRAANLGQQSGTFDIAQVQLEEGPVATEFERMTLGETMSLVGRYFQQIPEIAYSGACVTNTATFGTVPYLQRMRALPSVSRNGNLTINDTANTYTSSGADGTIVGLTSFRLTVPSFSGLTQNRFFVGQSADTRWHVDARL